MTHPYRSQVASCRGNDAAPQEMSS